jgi:environmental stress-induced protein Ves
METRLVEHDSFRRMRWRNGGGSTLELEVERHVDCPEPVLRVSVADVTEDGPFSVFPGYDRTLTLISGHGMTLNYDEQSKDVLGYRFASASFEGEVQTHSLLHDGPTQDFNVFTLRTHYTHNVSVLPDRKNEWYNEHSHRLLIYSVEADARVIAPNSDEMLVKARSLLKVDQPVKGVWRIESGPVILVSILSNRVQK